MHFVDYLISTLFVQCGTLIQNIAMSSNISVTDMFTVEDVDPFFFAFQMFNMVAILVGNSLTVIAVAKYRSLRTVTNIFTVSLASSDLLLAIILPYYSILNYTSFLTDEEQMRLACFLSLCFVTISQASSLFNLMLVAIDRYIAIFYALQYAVIMTKSRAFVMVLATWVYTVGFTSFTIYTLGEWPQAYCSMSLILPSSLNVAFLVVNVVSVLTVTIFLYSRIFYIARKQARLIAVQDTNVTSRNPSQRQSRVTRMMAMVLGLFLMCWFPYTCMNILRSRIKNASVWLDIIYKLSICILYSNSFFNPIVFGWKNKTFRAAFAKLLHCSDNGTNLDNSITMVTSITA